MKYTNDGDGRLNNFAVEPKMYRAEAPDEKQKRNSLILTVGTAILVAVLIFIAVSISS